MLFSAIWKAFFVGGCLCVIGQLLIDLTGMTPARILVTFVTAGIVLTAVGLYAPLVEWAQAGATVPLLGFGYVLAEGTKEAVETSGFLGALTGGLSATAGGVSAAVFLGFLCALLSRSKSKTA